MLQFIKHWCSKDSLTKLIKKLWEQFRTKALADNGPAQGNNMPQLIALGKTMKEFLQKTLKYIFGAFWVIFLFLRKSSAVSFCIYRLPTLCKTFEKNNEQILRTVCWQTDGQADIQMEEQMAVIHTDGTTVKSDFCRTHTVPICSQD